MGGPAHAAALALLGGTLVYPPFNAKSRMLDTNLPLEKMVRGRGIRRLR